VPRCYGVACDTEQERFSGPSPANIGHPSSKGSPDLPWRFEYRLAFQTIGPPPHSFWPSFTRYVCQSSQRNHGECCARCRTSAVGWFLTFNRGNFLGRPKRLKGGGHVHDKAPPDDASRHAGCSALRRRTSSSSRRNGPLLPWPSSKVSPCGKRPLRLARLICSRPIRHFGRYTTSSGIPASPKPSSYRRRYRVNSGRILNIVLASRPWILSENIRLKGYFGQMTKLS